MSEEINPEAPAPNGAAHDMIPVLGTDPAPKKKRRKRKAKPSAPKVARTPKVKAIDPLIAEQLSSVMVGTAAAVEEAPAPVLLAGVGADHFVEARERIHEKQFRSDVRAMLAPPIRSSWRDRFVFGLRRMTGTDKPAGEPEPVRLSTTLTAFLLIAAVGASAGAYMAWF